MATAALAFAPDPSPGSPVVLTPKDNAGIVHVVPGQLRLGTGSKQLTKVKWQNNTGGKVTITFDRRAAEFFVFNPPSDANGFEIGDGASRELEVSKSLTPGIHMYHVTCEATNNGLAQGNSEPTVSCP